VTAVSQDGRLIRIGRAFAARLLKTCQEVNLTPFFLGEHSSGSHRRRGSITKTGNAHARCALIEAAWQYRLPARITPIIAKRQEGVSEPVRALAWKAQQRLCHRYRRLAARQLHKNKVVTALARELAGFVWAIVREARASH
jgi:transposase